MPSPPRSASSWTESSSTEHPSRLVSELDGKLDEGKQKEIIRWCKLLDSASTEFQSERRRSVTHSFRSLVDKDGAESNMPQNDPKSGGD